MCFLLIISKKHGANLFNSIFLSQQDIDIATVLLYFFYTLWLQILNFRNKKKRKSLKYDHYCFLHFMLFVTAAGFVHALLHDFRQPKDEEQALPAATEVIHCVLRAACRDGHRQHPHSARRTAGNPLH